jgi:uncharacterized phosphosugar-binding protein
MASKAMQEWLKEHQKSLEGVSLQTDKLEKVSKRIYDAIKGGGVLHVFGSGHSNMVTEEFFHRAGGLIPVNPIFEPMLMPSAGPRKTGPLERMAGVGKIIFGAQEFISGEVLILASNSGINPATVELAELAKAKGVYTVALTSLTHSKAVPARNNGKKLYEVVDESIDTCTPIGDACVTVQNSQVKVGPLSSAVCTVICELLVVRVAEMFGESGEVPPIYQSANVPGGEDRNRQFEEKYRSRIKYL